MEDGRRETDAAQSAPQATQSTPAAGSDSASGKAEVIGEPKKVSEEAKSPARDSGSGPPKENDRTGGPDRPEESAIREWLELVGRAAFWALVLYLFVFQVSVVEGPSMQPNFQTYDRLVIDKLTYKVSAVQRFDVVVFQAVEDRRWGGRENKDYIKRVIGLPGERVKLVGDSVFVNGKAVSQPFDYEHSSFPISERDEFVVPPKHFFVLGDNRMDSKDSHNGLGYVPESQIRGIARLRFMPLSRWKWFWRE